MPDAEEPEPINLDELDLAPYPDPTDSPWKDAIQYFLQPFLQYCFPDVAEAVEWSRAPEFLEQELRELLPEAVVGPQRVDQLVRVWQLDGTEQWLLLHIEIQSQPDPKLARRLYQYHHRLVDQHGEPVVSLCVLADPSPRFHPTQYSYELYGCGVTFTFRTCKLIDIPMAELESSLNPIAVVIAAHRAMLETKKRPRKRLNRKLELVRHMEGRGLPGETGWRLLRVIDSLMRLPAPLKLEFRARLDEDRSKRNPTMAYMTSFEEIALEKGLAQGQLLHAVNSVLRQLKRRFDADESEFQPRLTEFTELSDLDRLFDEALNASTLDDFRERLARFPH